MARKRLLRRLYPKYLAVALLSLLAIVWYVSGTLRESYLKQRADDLEAVVRLVSWHLAGQLAPLDKPGSADGFCREAAARSGMRITIMLPSGEVVGDSDEASTKMDNHRSRPEMKQALDGERGQLVRYSDTVRMEMLYVAVPLLQDGALKVVVRGAVPLHNIAGAIDAIRVPMLVGGVGIAVLSVLGGLLLARRVVKPLQDMKRGAERFAAGDLATRLPVPDSEEIGGLAEVMNKMALQLDERIHALTRQRNEQEAILFSMIEGVVAVDTEERIISMNKSAAQMLGVDAAGVVRKSILEVVRNGELQKFVSRAVAGPDAVEGEIVLRNGSERYLQVHGALLCDASRRAIGAVIVLNDISRLRRLESMRTDFVANVSHELRTPITSIKGFVETLLDGALRNPKDAERFLSVIAKQVERLNAIIDDLLTLSRVEQDRESAIVTQQHPLCEILEDAVQVCTLKAEEKGIEIHLECDKDLVARMNPALLEQAVVNLIENAVKYSEPGSPVSVEAGKVEGSVQIKVADRGSGIGREHLPRIFERFYRVDKARSRKLGGTGLGLAIVKHIVQAHGGRVTVESTLGKGSTFTIVLPAP